MTLTPEQLREAVELADGFEEVDQTCFDGEYIFRMTDNKYVLVWSQSLLPKFFFAALASQLISQVDASRAAWFQSSREGIASVHIDPHRHEKYDDRISSSDGPNRDENSILACTEFLRNTDERGQTDG